MIDLKKMADTAIKNKGKKLKRIIFSLDIYPLNKTKPHYKQFAHLYRESFSEDYRYLFSRKTFSSMIYLVKRKMRPRRNRKYQTDRNRMFSTELALCAVGHASRRSAGPAPAVEQSTQFQDAPVTGTAADISVCFACLGPIPCDQLGASQRALPGNVPPRLLAAAGSLLFQQRIVSGRRLYCALSDACGRDVQTFPSDLDQRTADSSAADSFDVFLRQELTFHLFQLLSSFSKAEKGHKKTPSSKRASQVF